MSGMRGEESETALFDLRCPDIQKGLKGTPSIRNLVKRVGGRFSANLGIDLSSADGEETFKWFLASFLFGARISEGIAIKTYREFEREGILSPEDILNKGWDGLVETLDRGGYVRYDFKTATKLLDVSRALSDDRMNMKDFPDFEVALLRLGKDYCKKMACERCPLGEDCRCRKEGSK